VKRMHIEKREFNSALFVWCVIDDDGVVIYCRKSESEAKEAVDEVMD